ncbi:MAG: hypothetical protein EXS58_17530 [Candidatus Latescibacteria bacterium]|nr:hypothetical protein [Candidatus Latescibacterota bacterium]
MRLAGSLLVACGLIACGGPERDNPLDPKFIGREEPGIQLVADFPADQELGPLMSSIRFAVSAPELSAPVQGEMNLVGGQARAEVRGIPAGPNRIFRVEALDANLIRTFAATDTLTVDDPPRQVRLQMARLRGSLELSAQLPPEIVALEVRVSVQGDTLDHTYEVSGFHEGRIEDIPTGTNVRVELTGRDGQQQVLLQRELAADVRDDLVAHLSITAEVGALQITARFPAYVPRAVIDRFSDAAGLFYRRSENAKLPGPDKPIDFDSSICLQRGFGPNSEIIWFYNFDAKGTVPAPVYVLVDRIGQPLPGQLPIFDLLPGDPGYSDLWQIYKVRILERDYPPNSLSSFQVLKDGAYEITATNEVMHCVLAPAGSKASQRFDSSTPSAAQQGWYRDQIVDYLLFENPNSTAQVDFGAGKVNAPEMFAFFENDLDPSDGFALDPLATGTHNVATRLPGQEGYAPLWVLTIFKLDFFDQVKSVANALDQSRDETSLLTLPGLLYVDAPIVKVE